MDYMEKITELRASKAKLNEQAQALVTEGKFEDANKLADQMEGINKQIQAVERLLDESRKHAVPLEMCIRDRLQRGRRIPNLRGI